MTSLQEGTQVPVTDIRRRHGTQTFDGNPKRMKRSWMPETLPDI